MGYDRDSECLKCYIENGFSSSTDVYTISACFSCVQKSLQNGFDGRYNLVEKIKPGKCELCDQIKNCCIKLAFCIDCINSGRDDLDEFNEYEQDGKPENMCVKCSSCRGIDNRCDTHLKYQCFSCIDKTLENGFIGEMATEYFVKEFKKCFSCGTNASCLLKLAYCQPCIDEIIFIPA